MVKEFKYSQKDSEEQNDVTKTYANVTTKEEQKEIKSIQANIKEGKPVLAREEAKANGKRAKMANWE